MENFEPILNPTPAQKRAKKYLGTYLSVILIFVSFALGLLVGQIFLLKKDVTNAQGLQIEAIFYDRFINHSTMDFSQFWTVWDMIREKYVKKDKLQDKDLFYGALQGLVASIGDPYSLYFVPKEAEEFSKDMAGELEGIGAEIAVRDNQLVIVSPLPDSPAEKAGLLPGDKIMFINEEATTGMDINTAVSKIRGPAKTEVVLTVNRSGKTRKVAIVRAKINVPAILYKLQPGNIAYLRIMQFNENTIFLLDQYVNKMKEQKVTGIILDLRNNPGGYLETAVEMASEWIDKGIIVSEKNSNGTTKIHETKGLHRLAEYKTVVLVNKGSASAAEIVAGALQDRGKAAILGETTFGKGSVQEYQNFPDGSALKLTVAEWYTPGGKNINEAGITPDIEFKQDYDKEKPGQDSMLKKALTLFSTKK